MADIGGPVEGVDPTVGASPGGDEERSFEDLVGELEAVTDRLATGELGIEAATDLYERAELLHRLASDRLAQVTERVARLPSPPGPGRSDAAPGS
jgi:exodeoxyribonuclease VII small subunit